jgi:FlaA1/EpsC-like NDP-sugar epimerase
MAAFRWRVVLHDLLVIPVAWLLAYWLRYNLGVIPEGFLDQAISVLPLVIVLQGLTLIVFGVHQCEWRFISLPDLALLMKAVLVGTMLIALMLFLAVRLEYIPRSVFVLYAMLLLAIMCGTRLTYRLLKDRHFATRAGSKVLIVGAGAAGEQLVRDLRRNYPEQYNIVAYVDDDEAKIGGQIHRIPVAASCDGIGALVDRWAIELILIAVPSATDRQMQRIVQFCDASGTNYRTLPGVHELLSGQVGITDLREVRIEDLLGRDPVKLDWEGIRASLKDRVVLVTGAGGSIGSELCRQLAAVSPAGLVLFERGEYNLYSIEQELSEQYPELELHIVLGDICDENAVRNIFEKYRPAVVFNAAAYKQFPHQEGQVREAVKNNVVGTQQVADMALKYQCESFVLISTDKAVNPTSLMGACKRVAEIYCQALALASKSRFITVRFGNVLGSAGSVVPKFQRQIRSGGPVTVTHPEITRYFMTIIEATQLILEASAVGQDGRIYVLDMGKPIRVAYLAEQMIRLSGKTLEDIPIEYTGLRPGEKLIEELFHADEPLSDTGNEKILLAATRPVNAARVSEIIDQVRVCLHRGENSDLLELVCQLVPEYYPGRDEAGDSRTDGEASHADS